MSGQEIEEGMADEHREKVTPLGAWKMSARRSPIASVVTMVTPCI
jgi:hypothetical protein